MRSLPGLGTKPINNKYYFAFVLCILQDETVLTTIIQTTPYKGNKFFKNKQLDTPVN